MSEGEKCKILSQNGTLQGIYGVIRHTSSLLLHSFQQTFNIHDKNLQIESIFTNNLIKQ